MSEEDSEKHAKHEHEHKHKYIEHEQHRKHQTYQTATWILGAVSVVLLVLFIASIATSGFGGSSGSTSVTGKTLSASDVKAKTETYLKNAVAGQTFTVDSVTDTGSLYQINLTVAGRPYNSYASKDGSLLFPSAIDMTAPVQPAAAAAAQQPTVVPKTDKPTVELFVMSHCPFGTQAEKGILPAVRTLGDKVDFKIRFVYYAMHGEKEVKEQLTQYCIQTEQNDKYLKYLACFLNDSVGQGSADASNACVVSTGVDKAKLDACKVTADTQFNVMKNFNDKASWLSGQFPKFDTDAALNTKYNVGGSPTLVINGVNSNAGRDSASFLAGICAAFNNAPAECQTQLSATPPGAGFGYDSVGAANAAGCGV